MKIGVDIFCQSIIHGNFNRTLLQALLEKLLHKQIMQHNLFNMCKKREVRGLCTDERLLDDLIYVCYGINLTNILTQVTQQQV